MNLETLRKQLAALDPAAQVVLDFGVGVAALDSWRGDYTEATLTWADRSNERLTVGDLLAKVDAALAGEIFQGYKGGDFRFNTGTDVYADDYGSADGNRTLCVVERWGQAVVITQPGGAA